MEDAPLRFTPARLARPAPTWLAVETTLEHFSIVTYGVEPDALRACMHPRFEPDVVEPGGRSPCALVSVVTFLDRDFRFVRCPRPRFTFGQTNYRAYATDTETGEHVAWFFGTALASRAVLVPRHAWGLPWHHARMSFECCYDERGGRYASYRVDTESRVAPARLVLEDSGEEPRALAGFPDLETGLVLVTHPTRGVYFRRDGALGTYAIWHDRMRPTVARVEQARHPLLERLGLLPAGGSAEPHSVLLQRSIDFTIYLPPLRLGRGRLPRGRGGELPERHGSYRGPSDIER